MGRVYAGILGPLAWAVVTLRGIRLGSGVESTLLSATVALMTFAAVGYVMGELARWIVEDSVRGRFQAELLARDNAEG